MSAVKAVPYGIISWLLVCLILASCSPAVLEGKDHSLMRSVDQMEKGASEPSVETLVQAEPLELTIVMKEHYLDGVVETTTKKETIWSMVDFWASYEGWRVENQELDRIVFQRQVEDISPLTKQHGYFGLNEDGELAVFQGIPNEGKVIESFKPIPVKPLESKRIDVLKNGIKIKDSVHFEQVVHQYSEEKQM
ncbi:BofC C-terminal domain-containing protein [Halobacillus kuroshimensis]|uniref:BofC C-terminal domain-containing protein n=1 Tax=Halobacillus kuroshimensis TaxID=302481 RepID=UPI001FD4EA9B|nr:BofC C-terminal domain-containing protein [Halobacillus kuroshimensis]